jgi:polysaccharide export outer membrane protein
MVKCIAPAFLLILLASCGTVSGSPPTDDQYDPRGFKPETARTIADGPAAGPESFPVLPDDELRITVMGNPDLTLEAKVPADGSIHYPMIGEVQLAGRTLGQIRDDIKARLEKDYLVSAQVSVQVRTYAPKRAYVLGAVGRAGEVEIAGGRFATLLQTIASAGGFAGDADRYMVLVYRAKELGSTQRIPYAVDVVALQEGRGQDPVILPNDVILVPSRERISVDGCVARPGPIMIPAGERVTATQAIAQAGGCTRIANDGNVRLSRIMKDGKRQNFVLDLSGRDGDAKQDVPLQPGDTLYVPESFF